MAPTLHPAVKGHLTELFKSLVTLPPQFAPDKHPAITHEAIQDRLSSISEKAGVSFSLIIAPPTFECLKVSMESGKYMNITIIWFIVHKEAASPNKRGYKCDCL